MDWKTFISNTIVGLAWPAVVLIAVLLFRGRLIELIPLMKKLKLGLLEAEFAKQTTDVLVEVRQIEAATQQTEGIREVQINDAVKVEDEVKKTSWIIEDPALVVMMCRSNLEGALLELAKRKGVVLVKGFPATPDTRVHSLIPEMQKLEIITRPLAKALTELLTLGESVADRELKPTSSAALRFEEATKAMIKVLKLLP